MKPSLTIAIINTNAWRDVRQCLLSFRANQEPDFDILVIDNASTDGSVANIQREFPGVRVHANPHNVGHPAAVNLAFSLPTTDYVLVLDADTEIQRESIEQLRSYLAEHPEVSVVTPRTYYGDGTVQETARGFPSVINGIFGRQSILSRRFPNNPFTRRYLAREHLNATDPFQVDQVSSACFMAPRSLIAEVGPWDEDFPPAYWDDTDWCLTLRKFGKKIYCLPQASVVHHEGNITHKKRSMRRIVMFHKGVFRLYRKHYTYGLFDPRLLVALALLSARALAMMVYNYFLTDQPAPILAEAPRAPAEERVS